LFILGNLIWSRDLPHQKIADIVIDKNDFVYVVIQIEGEGTVYKLNGESSEIMGSENFGKITGFYSLLIGVDDTLYTTARGVIFNFDSNLNLISSSSLALGLRMMCQDSNKNIYAIDTNGVILKLDTTYNVIWKSSYSTVAININCNKAGYIYLNINGELRLFDPYGIKIDSLVSSDFRSGMLLQPNLALVSTSDNNYQNRIFALQDNTRLIESITIKKEFQALP